MLKNLIGLPLLGLALIAAKPAPVAQPVKPPVSLTAPAEVVADPANRWTLELSNGGKVVVQLRPDLAPAHVYRIQQLTTQGFYNGLKFHRVIPGFMAQSGDPQGNGEGGSPLPDLAAEFNDLPHLRGVASMARSTEPNSANSQFFLMLAPRFSLDHKYSAFGRVIAGMAAIDGISVGEPPAAPTLIVRATIGGPLPAPPVIAVAPVVEVAAPAPSPEAAPVAEVVAPASAVVQPPAPAATPAPEATPPAVTPAPEATPPVVTPAPEAPAPQ